jgi:hypothetical protein
VYRLAYNGDVAGGQLAVFQGGPSRTGGKAPISESYGSSEQRGKTANRPRPGGGNVSAYRCVGVSAFAKHHQLSRDLLIIIVVSKAVLLPQTPISRPADTLPRPTAHFERNDITIICETVHEPAKIT